MAEHISCIMCSQPTTDQWGGYCHDCDNYLEAIVGDNMENGVVSWEREGVKEINPS